MTELHALPDHVASFREHSETLGTDPAFIVMTCVIVDGGGRTDADRVKALQDLVHAYAEDTGKAAFAWLGDARRKYDAERTIT